MIKVTKQLKFMKIILDDNNSDLIGSVKEQLRDIDNISEVEDCESKINAKVNTFLCLFKDLAEKIISRCSFNGVIEIHDQLFEYKDMCFRRLLSGKSFAQGCPITKKAIVVFNDKDGDNRSDLIGLLHDCKCTNIIINPKVSSYGRKYYLATFDMRSIDILDFRYHYKSLFDEEILTSASRDSEFYYNELLLETAQESSITPRDSYLEYVPQKRHISILW